MIPTNPTVSKAHTQRFTAVGAYSDGSISTLTNAVSWSSANTAVATISGDGLASGVAAGITAIQATMGPVSTQVPLTVTEAALLFVAVMPANLSLTSGGTQQFTATGTYSDGSTQNLTNLVSWSSSNTAVATIGSGGLATSIAAGSTTIQAIMGWLADATTLTVTSHYVSLSWTASTSSNLVHYNVYRSTNAGGPHTFLASTVGLVTSYTDYSVKAGQIYYYVTTAVDSTDTESSYSNQASAAVPMP